MCLNMIFNLEVTWFMVWPVSNGLFYSPFLTGSVKIPKLYNYPFQNYGHKTTYMYWLFS